MKKTLIIMSACNEAASLREYLPRLVKVTKQQSVPIEVLLIDDGSKDATVAVAKENGCRVVSNRRNRGIGASLRTGYKVAVEENFDFTVTMDADGQHDEKVLPRVLDVLQGGQADLVVASRYHKDSGRFGVPIDRDLLNISVTAQINIATGWQVTDPLCGFWGMTRPCFQFALTHGRQERYGVHLEHLIKFWYLCSPRPRRVEIPHPAIYENHGTHQLLTRLYSDSNKEQRVERFGTHALHIIEALDDVRTFTNGALEKEMLERRLALA